MSGGNVVLGIILAICGAAGIALSMVVQRYGLSYPEEKVPFLFIRLPRLAVWFIGLLVYGAANGFYAASLGLGPLSLLAGVFTTLLVFNMIFARLLLGEVLTPPKIIGGIVILLGVCCCAISAPSDAPTDFSAADLERLSKKGAGLIYIIILPSLVFACVIAILVYERKYPVDDLRRSHSESDVDARKSLRLPPEWLHRLMGLVYPGSLGLDEGIAHLTMKGSISMLGKCGDGDCTKPIFFGFISFWICASVATAWWLKIVFERYETTQALPIEYGLVNVASVCSGLIYYGEHSYMKSWQLVLNVCGVIVILSGIQIGRTTRASDSSKSAKNEPGNDVKVKVCERERTEDATDAEVLSPTCVAIETQTAETGEHTNGCDLHATSNGAAGSPPSSVGLPEPDAKELINGRCESSPSESSYVKSDSNAPEIGGKPQDPARSKMFPPKIAAIKVSSHKSTDPHKGLENSDILVRCDSNRIDEVKAPPPSGRNPMSCFCCTEPDFGSSPRKIPPS